MRLTVSFITVVSKTAENVVIMQKQNILSFK
jgi:hypothetical protein